MPSGEGIHPINRVNGPVVRASFISFIILSLVCRFCQPCCSQISGSRITIGRVTEVGPLTEGEVRYSITQYVDGTAFDLTDRRRPDALSLSAGIDLEPLPGRFIPAGYVAKGSIFLDLTPHVAESDTTRQISYT